jgi:hypothetical protein
MKRALETLLDEGLITALETVNIAAQPQRATQLGVRSVPWLQLGLFELEGLHSLGELRDWAQRAATVEGAGYYFGEALSTGHLPRVIAMTRRHPEHLDTLLQLAADADTELNIRIGISAVIEDMAGSEPLLSRLPILTTLAASADPRVRADASHFLAMTGNAQAVPALETLTQDAERSVRDVAIDSLNELRQTLMH